MNTPTPPPGHPTPGDRLAAARQRVEASRGRLINAFYPAPAGDTRPPTAAGGGTGPDDTAAGLWASALGSDAPWLALRRLGLRWWRRQPWHGSVELVAGTLASQARPLVQRHPGAALAAGAFAGAALVVAGPWLWRGTRRHAAPLREQLVGSLWATLGSASVQVAMAGALATWIERHSRPSNAAAQAAPPAADPG